MNLKQSSKKNRGKTTRLTLVASLFFILIDARSFASRTIYVPFVAHGLIHVQLHNISNVPQTVNITISGRPDFACTFSSTCGGHVTTEAAGGVCRVKSGFEVIAPGEFLGICGATNGDRSDTPAGYGGRIKITVSEDIGALIGGINITSSTNNPQPINGGKPF